MRLASEEASVGDGDVSTAREQAPMTAADAKINGRREFMTEPNEVSPRNRSSERHVVQSLQRIALEIIVGFVGVYAAFALSAYKETRDRIDRRHQIKRALIAELKPMPALNRYNAGGYLGTLAHWDSSLAAGKKIIPQPFYQATAVQNHVWETAKASGGLELLDVPTFLKASQFYSQWGNMLAVYGQLREFSITQIYPGIDRGIDSFYQPGTSKPREIFAVYRWDLAQLARMSDQLSVWSDSLITQLSKDTI
jgi:hypothetical protein